MVIAELLASLGVQVDQKSLKNVDAALGGVAKTATKILGGITAIFGGAAAGQFVKELIAVGGELDDASRRFGVSTGALQAWRYAAQQTGASAESVGNAMKFAAKNAYDAATGGKESAKAFKELGVEVKNADGSVRDTESVFLDTINGLAGIENNTERTALALKVLGRGAADMLPLIAQGADGIAKLRAEFEELGGGYSKEFVAQADQLGDSLDALTQSGKSLKSIFGVTVFPVLQAGVNVLIKMGKEFNRIVKGTRLIKMALIVMTAAFTAWGLAAMWAARQAIVAWLTAVAPFLLVAAAMAAVALVLDDIAALLTGGKSLIGQYLDEWLGVGTADRLVRDWTAGIEILTQTADELGLAIGALANDIVAFVENSVTAIDTFAGDWVTGIGSIKDGFVELVSYLTDKVWPIVEKFLPILGPLKSVGKWVAEKAGAATEEMFKGPAMKGRLGDSAAPDTGSFMDNFGGNVSYGERVNRDGSPFLNSIAPGVASAGAVHPAFLPGTVESPAGPTTVTVQNNSPITVHAPAGTSPRQIAREVRREMDARETAQADRVRRALTNRGQ